MNDRDISILIVDDEVPILKMLQLKLSRMGFDVDIAANGKDAINKIDHNLYDLIFTDIRMPDISGDEIFHYVKFKKNMGTPVVGMSGTPWLLEQSEFDSVLSKPFSFVELKNVISNLLSKNKAPLSPMATLKSPA